MMLKCAGWSSIRKEHDRACIGIGDRIHVSSRQGCENWQEDLLGNSEKNRIDPSNYSGDSNGFAHLRQSIGLAGCPDYPQANLQGKLLSLSGCPVIIYFEKTAPSLLHVTLWHFQGVVEGRKVALINFLDSSCFLDADKGVVLVTR